MWNQTKANIRYFYLILASIQATHTISVFIQLVQLHIQHKAKTRQILGYCWLKKTWALSLCLVWFCDGGVHGAKTEMIALKKSGLMPSPDQWVKKDRWKTLSEGEKAKHWVGPLTALMDLQTKTWKSICWLNSFHGFVTFYKASQIDWY